MRHKDTIVNLPPPDADGTRSWDSFKVGLLMDIRDELKELNTHLRCPQIQRMFGTINRIDKRLASKIPLKVK
jgi:hypothetical protein